MPGKKGFFGLVDDMNGDGKVDIFDKMLFDDMTSDEKKKSNWKLFDDEEDIDLFDEDYDELLSDDDLKDEDDAKHNPFIISTGLKASLAKDKNETKTGDVEDDEDDEYDDEDDEYDDDDGTILRVSFSVGNSEDEDEEDDPNDVSYIAYRLNKARDRLENYRGDKEQKKRCHFIIEGKETASHYLTYDGEFLYAQAIKDHFPLPFEIPNEKDEIETEFCELLAELVLLDIPKAMCIWEWCLDTFLPYDAYASYPDKLTSDVFQSIDCFGNEDKFLLALVRYMKTHPCFTDKLFGGCGSKPIYSEDIIHHALQEEDIETARHIVSVLFANSRVNVREKCSLINNVIELCDDGETVECMELFKEKVFPIVYTAEDIRIAARTEGWLSKMEEYIADTEESSEKYEYSRKNAWRMKYQDKEHKGLFDPIEFDSESEYLEAYEAEKYSWREYCSPNKFGISPMDFETEQEFRDAVHTAYAEEEKKKRASEAKVNENDWSIYSFCKVKIAHSDSKNYYFLTNGLPLAVGDRVFVPFGYENKEIQGIVVSVGECYGFSFPFPVDRLKNVIRKIEEVGFDL